MEQCSPAPSLCMLAEAGKVPVEPLPRTEGASRSGVPARSNECRSILAQLWRCGPQSHSWEEIPTFSALLTNTALHPDGPSETPFTLPAPPPAAIKSSLPELGKTNGVYQDRFPARQT